MTKKTITLAFTGASGMPYGLRLLEYLLEAGHPVYLLISQAAQVVTSMETDLNLPGQVENIERFLTKRYAAAEKQLQVFGQQQWSAPVASGSAITDSMVVCPCSSGCLAAIATGASNNLLERAADVTLKENKQLILVARETPLSAIHLEHMLKLARLGVTILPAAPGFYYQPQKIDDLVDFIVARILEQLDIEQTLLPKWGEKKVC